MRPGIVKDVTEYMAEGGYVDGDMVRFRKGRPEKFGGWVRETVTGDQQFTGVARAALSWSDLSSKKYLAVGTHSRLELLTDNTIYDITPVREAASLTDAIDTVDTESIVTIHDVNHGLSVDDPIEVISQATAVGGITLGGVYEVVEVVDADTFTIDAGVAANATDTTAGGALEINYLLPIGAASNGNLTGYSGGTWNTEGQSGQGYNRPRDGVGGLNLRQWSLDNWGEDLVACVREGGIYHWDTSVGLSSRAAILSNAPVENLFVLVSQPSRHLIAFGSEVYATSAFDPLIIRWAEQETLNNWDITATNTAGEYRLPKGNRIITAVQTRSEIIVFTESELYSMRYVGGNDVFAFEPLGTNVSIMSQNAAVDVNGVIVWEGLDGFYKYDGVVQILASTIDKYLFSQDGEGRVNLGQKEKTYAGINKEFNEIIWFQPRYDNDENSHYIVHNYVEDLWYFGTLNRTVWVDKETYGKPYAINTAGRLFVHETGKDADGSPIDSFIRTAYFDIEDGNSLMFVDRILPDVVLAPNRDIAITVYSKKYPHPRSRVVTKGPYYFDDTGQQISVRARGRQMSIEFRSNAAGGFYEIGKIRYASQIDGGR